MPGSPDGRGSQVERPVETDSSDQRIKASRFAPLSFSPGYSAATESPATRHSRTAESTPRNRRKPGVVPRALKRESSNLQNRAWLCDRRPALSRCNPLPPPLNRIAEPQHKRTPHRPRGKFQSTGWIHVRIDPRIGAAAKHRRRMLRPPPPDRHEADRDVDRREDRQHCRENTAF